MDGDAPAAVDAGGVETAVKERAMEETPVGITITDPSFDDNPLVYVNDAFVRITGYDRDDILGRNCRFLQGPDSDPDAVAAMRDAIAAEQPVTVELVNYRADGSRFWNEVTIFPLRNDDGDVTHFAGFQNDVTARTEAQLEVRRRRDELDHLVGRIDGLLGDVTEQLMRAASREESERRLADRIAAADPYVFAWFGEPDRTADRIVPSTWGGSGGPGGSGGSGGPAADGPSFAEVAIPVDADDPTARAFAERDLRSGPVDGTAGAAFVDAASVAAVPLAYGDRTYGVLTVYADAADAFAGQETVVIRTLGRTIATAINAAESRRVLTADNVVEAEFEIGDDDLFVAALSARADCQLAYEGSVVRDDDALSLFFTTAADADTVLGYAAEAPDVESAAHVSGNGDANLFEFRVGRDSVVGDLARQGVKTRELSADGGRARLRVEFPAGSDARAIADRLRDRYADAELVSYRERERPPTTKGEFIGELEARLTDRQLTALRTAYVSGYYDRDRTTGGDELAASMDISRATFHEHLRAAERKLIAEFFDR